MEQHFSVSELTRRIKLLLEDNLGQIMVQGEISGLSRPSSGHIYFTLKDERAQISAALFRNQAQKLRFDLENGQEVMARGRISLYEPRGSYQIIVDRIEPVGEGALQLAFEQLKDRLEKRGWFQEGLKKSLPTLPRGIGLVTSPTGAAVKDLIQVLSRRFSGIPILLAPSMVQGEHAAQILAHQVKVLDKNPEIDLIILGRGGGSLEDLWAFNEEILVEAVFAAKTPIISAVGHETDFTLTDYAADLRAPTPSAAAELAVPLKSDYQYRISEAQNRLTLATRQKFEGLSERLKMIEKGMRSPAWVIQSHSMRVDELRARLNQAVQKQLLTLNHRLERSRQELKHQAPTAKLERANERRQAAMKRLQVAMRQRLTQAEADVRRLAGKLDSLSPLSILERGYALVKDEEDRLIDSVEKMRQGQQIKIRLQDGEVAGKVEGINRLE